jgi:hypothetical protein
MCEVGGKLDIGRRQCWDRRTGLKGGERVHGRPSSHEEKELPQMWQLKSGFAGGGRWMTSPTASFEAVVS